MIQSSDEQRAREIAAQILRMDGYRGEAYDAEGRPLATGYFVGMTEIIAEALTERYKTGRREQRERTSAQTKELAERYRRQGHYERAAALFTLLEEGEADHAE